MEGTFSARNRTEVLGTLMVGQPKGMWRSPRSSALLPCSSARKAPTPRGVKHIFPSRARKFSSTLKAKAYSAAGQAASALHAMALLQVHRAKALKQLYESGAGPGVLQELRTATDLALWAAKVTARALGQTMSTLVVQERHL